MKDATNFVEAVLKLYEAVGPVWSIIIIIAIFVLPLLLKLYRDKQLQDAYREIINEKEKQIQRLADDNREWRSYFWHTKGLTEREIMQIERQSDVTPLTSPPSRRQSKDQGG